MAKVIPERCHNILRDNMKQLLSFNENNDFEKWREQLREKFLELTGIYEIQKNSCPLNFEIEEQKQKDGYKQIRFTIESEVGSVVPVYILIPDNIKGKTPVCITLQGHSTGFHNSIGEPKDDRNKDYGTIPDGAGTFAWQAIQRGFIAVAIEMRGMGETKPDFCNWGHACERSALQAFEMGRTVIGERMWDISKVIDALSNFPECDLDDISVTGNSGGGTMSFYSACFDDRIKFSAPCSSFSPYKTSIMYVSHCSCNFIPYALKYFEMQDLAALIAPRKLVIVQGKEDNIFPIEGVRQGYKTVQAIYEKAGCADNCRLVEKEDGHPWGRDIVWNALLEMRNR